VACFSFTQDAKRKLFKSKHGVIRSFGSVSQLECVMRGHGVTAGKHLQNQTGQLCSGHPVSIEMILHRRDEQLIHSCETHDRFHTSDSSLRIVKCCSDLERSC
jgi:hypothetical protein